MLRFSVFGIPVGVDWFFWLITILLSGRVASGGQADWPAVGVWTGVVFVSIVLHELGHALAGRRYGAQPSIVLHGFGGTTYLPGISLSRGQCILVSAAGPLAGFLAGLLILGADVLIRDEPRLLRMAIHDGLYVNFVWTIVNLLPIQPLDGGQILREILGSRRIQLTVWIGFVLAGVLCLWTFSVEMYFSSFMLAYLAYLNVSRAPVDGGVVKQARSNLLGN